MGAIAAERLIPSIFPASIGPSTVSIALMRQTTTQLGISMEASERSHKHGPANWSERIFINMGNGCPISRRMWFCLTECLSWLSLRKTIFPDREIP